MEHADWINQVKSTNIYTQAINNLLATNDTRRMSGTLELSYVSLGLAGEAGEVCNKIKKIVRDGKPIHDVAAELRKELGDVFYYWVAIHDALALNPEITIQNLFDKLRDRKERGVIGGSGDNR